MESVRSIKELVNAQTWHENEFVIKRVLQSLALVFVLSGVVNFFIKLVHNRRKIDNLRKQGLPIAPQWSWLTGNLMLLAKLSTQLPQGLHKTLMFSDILRDNFKEEGCCYIDLWPVSYPFLLIMSPQLASQAAQTAPRMTIERPIVLPVFFKPVAGGLNLFDLPGEDWKRWRNIFNKGFSTETLFTMVPAVLEETKIYRSVLQQKAKAGDLLELDTLTLRFTIALIGRTVLEINPLEQLNFVRDLVHWWNGRKMNNYAGAILDRRYRELQESGKSSKAKSVMDLVLEAYLKDQRKEGKPVTSKLDPSFRAFAITQIRLFLFVGHDSLSTTICYAMYLLSKNPAALQKLREELHSLSANTDELGEKILQEPQLLNHLPYTTAVLKETLRLFPPGSATRQGYDGVDLVGDQGQRLPIGGMFVWILHVAMHCEEKYWVDADKFVPERWLVEPGHRLYPMKDAWRAFEWGPRNCIGQALAMMEMKLVLAMIARDFDFVSGYEERDQGRPAKERMSYRGERAWLMERGAAHPADMMPCRIKLAAAADKKQ